MDVPVSDSDSDNYEFYSNEFKFMERFDLFENSTNGLVFTGIYIPEEILTLILSSIPPQQLLELSLVCKYWCNLIKSESIWKRIFERNHSTDVKNIPWYVYYCYLTTDNFINLLKNGNGEMRFEHWKIKWEFEHGFKIEDPPQVSDPLPKGVPEFHGKTSCFSTSTFECEKYQDIELRDKNLLQYIIRKFRPHIYASEWVAGRFDFGCNYKLELKGYVTMEDGKELYLVFAAENTYSVEQWLGKKWEKVEVLVKNYSDDIHTLRFEHEGYNSRFRNSHSQCGSKMAGGVVKFLFESIKP